MSPEDGEHAGGNALGKRRSGNNEEGTKWSFSQDVSRWE